MQNVLTITDHLASKLSPINLLIEKLADRLLHKTVAQACGGILCVRLCGAYCNHFGDQLYIKHYAVTVAECNAHKYSCSTQVCGCPL